MPLQDSDGDGTPDIIELRTGSNPVDPNSPTPGGNGGTGATGIDTDNDGIPDSLEDSMCVLYPTLDNCGVTDGTQIEIDQDTDNDGISDYLEVLRGTDPTDNSDPGGTPATDDNDGDGIDDLEENAGQ